MAKLKFKDENNEFIPVVQDVKVNANSVFDGKDANIRLKTINNQSIVGSGNIDAGGTVDDVKVNGTSVVTNRVANVTVPSVAGLASETYVTNSISTHNSSSTAHNDIRTDITGIEDKIPSQASSSNQLADKDFVNSSISTNTANFIGTFNSVAELEAYSGTLTNNDYAFVIGTDSAGNTEYNRYKYTTATTPAGWEYEYTLNNSSFTANQWAAINSGITSTAVANITSVVANPTMAGTEGDITSIQIDSTKYKISGGSTIYRKTLTNASANYSVANNVVTITDSDVTTNTDVTLYPSDATTETWLENNLSSCIITQSNGSFSFNIDASLPATFSLYYIITEVQ